MQKEKRTDMDQNMERYISSFAFHAYEYTHSHVCIPKHPAPAAKAARSEVESDPENPWNWLLELDLQIHHTKIKAPDRGHPKNARN